MNKFNRRSALVGGLVASALSVIAPTAPSAGAAPAVDAPASVLGLHPSDPLPAAWDGWRNQSNGDKIGGLLELMQIEASLRTHVNGLDGARIAAHNAYLRQWGDDSREGVYAISRAHEAMLVAIQDQSFALGYAIAMTRDQAPHGPEVWYQAALKYAGIIEMTAAEEQVVDDQRNAIVDENWELQGYQKIDTAAAGKGGPVNSALDLVRLAGYVPRPPVEET